VGLTGIPATAAALVTANRRWLPWMMLCVGTAAVLVAARLAAAAG